jgi:hypothetical protein
MLGSVAGLIDTLLVRLLMAGARRRWPLLRLVPSSWLGSLLAPPARRLRCSLGHGALRLSVGLAAAGVLVMLVR